MKAKCIKEVERFTFDNKKLDEPYFEVGDLISIDTYEGKDKEFHFDGKKDRRHEMSEGFFFEHFQIINEVIK